MRKSEGLVWGVGIGTGNRVRAIPFESDFMQEPDPFGETLLCLRCRREKPRTAEFFYSRGGVYRGWCRECSIQYTAERKRQTKQVVRPKSEDPVEKRFIQVRDGIYRRHIEKKFDGEVVSTRNLLDLHQEQAGKCFYTGLEYIPTGRDPLSLVVHRMDREKGYIEGNVVLCCFFFVTAKNEWPLEKMKLLWTHLPQIPAL